MAAAARDVLVPLLTQLAPPFVGAAGVISVEADYTAALAAIPDGPAKTQGVELGQAVAKAFLALRAADGAEGEEENGFSRILVGFHFRDAVETGIKHG